MLLASANFPIEILSADGLEGRVGSAHIELGDKAITFTYDAFDEESKLYERKIKAIESDDALFHAFRAAFSIPDHVISAEIDAPASGVVRVSCEFHPEAPNQTTIDKLVEAFKFNLSDEDKK